MSALAVSDVSRNFGGVQALSNVSFEVAPGERRLIIGPNGAGKTTLFNLLSGALAASDGQVRLFGRDITNLPPYERARMGLARTFQITNLFPRLTVLENVLLALQAADKSAFSMLARMRANRALFQNAKSLLQEWGLAAIAGRVAREISYGEQRQIDLILAMAMRPKVLLLDEPTSGSVRCRSSSRRRHGTKPAEGHDDPHDRARHGRGLRARGPHNSLAPRPFDRARAELRRSATIHTSRRSISAPISQDMHRCCAYKTSIPTTETATYCRA